MTDWIDERLGLSPIVQERLLASVLALAAIVALRWLVLRSLRRRMEDPGALYRVRKTIGYITSAVVVIVLSAIWAAGFRNLATYFGLLSAGVAIALSDLLKNLAGWIYLALRRPFWLGDRIEVGEHAGDVIDVRAFRFTILEIGNWVDADQSTGRIIHVPNGKIFTEAVANFTQGFEFIWHEIPVMVTFESDWERAEEIVKTVLDEHNPEARSAEAAEKIRRAARAYLIQYTHLTPTVYVTVKESGVLITGRLMVPARQRRSVEQEIWRGILRAFAAEPNVELAYPTVRHYLRDPVRLERPGADRDR